MKKLIATFLTISMLVVMSGSIYAASISANGSLITDNIIDVKAFGAKGDGVTDDTNAIEAAIEVASYEHGTVYFPSGEYAVGRSISLASNIRLLGTGGSSVITDKYFPEGTTDITVFDSEYIQDVTIEGMKFVSIYENIRTIYFIRIFAGQRINVFNNICIGGGLLYMKSNLWSAIEDHQINRDIIVRDNYIDGKAFNDKQLYHLGIMLMGTENAVVSGNRITDARHGVQWWGGDANHQRDGQPENERKTKNIVITNNVITRVSGGGIWGAMGQNITISGNVIDTAHDVGIDPEGCYYVTISNNIVRDGMNGGITTFFFGRGTVITGNTVYSSVAGQYGLRVKNAASTTQNEDMVVSGNTFINTSDGLGYVGGDGIEKIIYQDNVFKNVALYHMWNGNRYTKVNGNQFTFDCPLVDANYNTEVPAVRVGVTNNLGQTIVQDNIIRSVVPQTEISAAIFVQQTDNTSSSENIVSGNIISGFTTDVILSDLSSKKTVKQIFNVSDNIFDSGMLRYQNAYSSDSDDTYPVYNNNRMSDGSHYIGEIPQEGYWRKGQIIYYNYPELEGYVGAICVEGGSPGKWMSFGDVTNGE